MGVNTTSLTLFYYFYDVKLHSFLFKDVDSEKCVILHQKVSKITSARYFHSNFFHTLI